MKKNSLMFILTFLLGAAVLLFLLGLKSRTSGVKVLPNDNSTTPLTTVKNINQNEEKIANRVQTSSSSTTTTVKEEKTQITSEKFNKENVCPLIESNIGKNDLIQKLENMGILTSKMKTMRKNIHILTKEDKKLRLSFSRKEQDNLSTKLTLKVLEEKQDGSFSKVKVPENYKTNTDVASILKHYNSKEIVYKEEVNIFDSDDLEILFESLDDKVVSFNALTRDFSNTFSCRFKK